MIKLFEKPQTIKYNIIALQKLWQRLDYSTRYHLAKDYFELLYFNNLWTRVYIYINKKIALAL